jgi:hypothetical protein
MSEEQLEIAMDARKRLEPIRDEAMFDNDPNAHMLAASVAYLSQWISAKTEVTE